MGVEAASRRFYIYCLALKHWIKAQSLNI